MKMYTSFNDRSLTISILLLNLLNIFGGKNVLKNNFGKVLSKKMIILSDSVAIDSIRLLISMSVILFLNTFLPSCFVLSNIKSDNMLFVALNLIKVN